MSVSPATISCDILIVGAGIAGSAFAAAIRTAGYSVVQVEMSDAPLDTARGDHLQCVVVEQLDAWGMLPAFWAAGAEKRHGARYVTPTGELLMYAPHAGLPIPHPYYLYVNHETIASTFLTLASENPSYTRFAPARARQFERDATGITALTIRLADSVPAPAGYEPGQDIVIRPKIVIGADGRSSRVRDVMEFSAVSHDYDSPLVVLFGPRLSPDPSNEVKVFMSAHGACSRIPRTGGMWKVGLPIQKSEIAFWKTATMRMRQSALAQRAPELDGFAAELGGFYPVKLINTAQWARGNTVLLGDACHAMHPARGQGMNVAIRCIARLIDLLPDPADLADAETVAKRLRAFEAGTKPAVDKVLAENHARGEQMDSLDAGVVAATSQAMQKIAEDPELLRRYRMQSAGYADALSALSG